MRIPVLALACLLATRVGAEVPARLSGRVTGEAGGPVAGALVTARNVALARETTVYADPEGRWALPPLEPGRYHLRARRPGFRDRAESLELAGGARASRVLVLARETDPRELAWQLPANRWLALATGRLPDEAAREEFLRQCTFCHQQGSWATRVQRDAEEWRKIFTLMARMGGILSTRVRTVLPEVLNAAYDESSYVPALGEHFSPPPPPLPRPPSSPSGTWAASGRCSTTSWCTPTGASTRSTRRRTRSTASTRVPASDAPSTSRAGTRHSGARSRCSS
jgi:hypothetical protein